MIGKRVVFLAVSSLILAGGLASSEELKAAPAATGAPAQIEKKAEAASEKAFTVVAIEYEGSKVWVPGTLIVKKSDKVKINLINNIKSEPNTHGYAIDAYGIKEVIARGEPKSVTFTADKTGIFTIYCQLHPKHIGGQLLVLE